MKTTHEDVLNVAERRLVYQIANGTLNVDNNFVGHFERLLSLTKNVIPVFSCEGHVDNEQWHTPYVMFYVNEKGLAILELMMDLIHKEVETANNRDHYLYHCLKRVCRLTSFMPDKRYVTAYNWVFDCKVTKETLRLRDDAIEVMFSKLHEAINLKRKVFLL